MKILHPVVASAAILLFMPPALHAQKDFEGTVAFTMEMATQMGPLNVEIEQFVKQGKVRQIMKGMPTGDMITLMEAGSGTMTMLMPSQKVYMTMDIGGLTGQAIAADEVPKITKTGRRETVAGHECEHIDVSSSQGKIDICVATGLGYYFIGGTAGGGASSAGFNPGLEDEIRKVFGDAFFPLKVTAELTSGTVSMVATRVEQKALPDDLFVIPEGYTKMSGPGGF